MHIIIFVNNRNWINFDFFEKFEKNFLDKYPYQYLTHPYYDDPEILSDYISNSEDIEKDYRLQIKNGAIDKQDSSGNPVDV